MKPAYQLARDIAEGRLTSEELVRACLDAIDKDNLKGRKLRAIIRVRPEEQALQDARKRDQEALEGKRRGPLHGLPLVLKVGCCDSTCTHSSRTRLLLDLSLEWRLPPGQR